MDRSQIELSELLLTIAFSPTDETVAAILVPKTWRQDGGIEVLSLSLDTLQDLAVLLQVIYEQLTDHIRDLDNEMRGYPF